MITTALDSYQPSLHIWSHCQEIFQCEKLNFHRSVSCDSSASAGGNVDNVVGGPIATAVSVLNRLLNNGPEVQPHDKDATPGASYSYAKSKHRFQFFPAATRHGHAELNLLVVLDH